MSFLPMKKEISHVGMIIHSTTLDTEDKVKAIYGGKTWIQHTGYMLRGASSGVTPNSAINDGGEDSHTLTVNEIPSHSHNIRTEFGTNTNLNQNPSANTYAQISGTNSGTKHWRSDLSNTGGGQAHNNIPKYKSVYIWERTA